MRGSLRTKKHKHKLVLNDPWEAIFAPGQHVAVHTRGNSEHWQDKAAVLHCWMQAWWCLASAKQSANNTASERHALAARRLSGDFDAPRSFRREGDLLEGGGGLQGVESLIVPCGDWGTVYVDPQRHVMGKGWGELEHWSEAVSLCGLLVWPSKCQNTSNLACTLKQQRDLLLVRGGCTQHLLVCMPYTSHLSEIRLTCMKRFCPCKGSGSLHISRLVLTEMCIRIQRGYWWEIPQSCRICCVWHDVFDIFISRDGIQVPLHNMFRFTVSVVNTSASLYVDTRQETEHLQTPSPEYITKKPNCYEPRPLPCSANLWLHIMIWCWHLLCCST